MENLIYLAPSLAEFVKRPQAETQIGVEYRLSIDLNFLN